MAAADAEAVEAADKEANAEADEDVPRKDARLGGRVTLPLLPPFTTFPLTPPPPPTPPPRAIVSISRRTSVTHRVAMVDALGAITLLATMLPPLPLDGTMACDLLAMAADDDDEAATMRSKH